MIGSLFSGIGGLELGLEWAGLGPVAWQCEIDPFCRSVLRRHWPDTVIYNDVREVGHGAARVRVLCGGFPCQDVSLAGKGAGLEGARSGLWFEFARLISEVEPPIVVIENVPGLRTRGLRRVLADLSDLGFDAEWCDLSASEVGAPHRRTRLFVVSVHPGRAAARGKHGWLDRACRDASNSDSGREPEQSGPVVAQWQRTPDGGWWPPVSPIRRVDDGIPNRSHGRRLKALGNAVVPQCAYVIGRAIIENVEVAT